MAAAGRHRVRGKAGALLLSACLLLPGACVEKPPTETAAADSAPTAGFRAPRVGTYTLPPIQDAVDGTVLDADGSRSRLFDYLGDRYVFLSFIYTNCGIASGCPLAFATLHAMQRRLDAAPELQDQVRFITFSFDPERDTPAVMRRFTPRGYADTPISDRSWVFLTTPSRVELEPILEGFGQYIVPEVDESGEPTGDLSHILKVFLIDRQRQVRNIYSSSHMQPALVLNDLKTLVREDERSR